MTAPLTLETFDPFAPENLSAPHPGWALLRREAPVYRVDMPSIPVPVYFVTRQQEIAHIARHPELFSNRPVPSVWRWGDFAEPEIAEVFARAGYKVVPALQAADPPLSQRHRKLLDEALGRQEVAGLKARIRGLIDRLIELIPEGQPVDFVDAFAVPLPLQVILMLLEIPDSDHDFFRKYTDEFAKLIDPVFPAARAAEAAETIVAGYAYFERAMRRYRETPADNLMSLIANTRFDGENPASIDEALAFCNNTIIAGNETTRNSLASALYLLALRPDLWRRLQAEQHRVPDFVEEILRFAAPANTTPRSVVEDTELAGVKLTKGSCLFILWGSGSLDEAVFKDPEAFDIDRRNKRGHTAFGLGARHCPGNILARAELAPSVEAWLEAFETVSFAVPAEEVRYEPIFGFHALGHLPLIFTRRAG